MERHKILEIKNLKIAFQTFAGKVTAVDNLSISLDDGQSLGIVGESGSGKSVSMLSVLKILPSNGIIENGEIYFNGKNITHFSNKMMQKIRGSQIGTVFQDPMTSLNPLMSIGEQLTEVILKHNKFNRRAAKDRAFEMLGLVGIPDYERRFHQYPYQFSGGMRQRVLIAMALSCNPKLLIADEPTTALDVTIQAQIIELIKNLKKKINMSVILITHDLGLVADVCGSIAVMYGGRVVEMGTAQELFHNPRHPYTIGLLKCIPQLNAARERLIPIPGYPPDLTNPSKGCSFAQRCEHALEICFQMKPEYFAVSNTQKCSCWLLDQHARRFSNG
jgi:oligopeptide transport system ATP-binding protein